MKITIDNINQFIADNKIPLSFVWEPTSDIQKLECYFNGYITTYDYSFNNLEQRNFPNWYFRGKRYDDECGIYFYYRSPFKTTKTTIDECFGEFLFWWEINKHKCTDIKYYEI